MPPSDPESPSPEEPESRDATPEGGHISFVERLRRQFGPDVDPRITLRESEEEESEEREEREEREAGGRTSGGEDSSSGSSTSRGLLRKLSGQVSIASRYEVKREVARGGMGTILRVWDDDLRRNLAMKVMHGRSPLDDESGTSAADEEKLGRFLEEAQITGQLDHPGIVPVHDLGIDREGRCFFTMRLVRGRELKEVLDLARERKEGWTITKALSVILKVCEAMAYAHSKMVIHRDLKPSNVMVGRFGETYVMDWGLARVLRPGEKATKPSTPEDGGSSMSLVRTVRREESDANPESPLVTMDGDVVGTPAYMALEQAQGRLDELGPRSDIYSLGTILYYMLTGRSPYVEPGERVSPHTVLNRVLAGPPVPASKLAKNMPSELVAICEKAMARHREDRYGGMLDVAGDIQAYLENRVVRAYEGGSIAEFRKWVSRNRAFAAALTFAIVLTIASALGFAIQKSRRMSALEGEKERTAAALTEAQKSAKIAQEQKDLADLRREEADENARIAREKEDLARLSGYKANILTADFSFRIGDIIEARRRLDKCDEDMRGWEWGHLSLKGSAALFTKRFTGQAADCVAFTPDGQRGLILGRSGMFRVLDLESQEVVPPNDISMTPLLGSSFLPLTELMDVTSDGAWVALAGRDHTIEMYDMVHAGDPYLFPPPRSETAGHEGSRVSALAFSPNRRYLASGADDGGIILWDADPASREFVQRLTAHRRAITGIAWAPDSARLASSSTDGTVRIWDALTGTALRVLKGHAGTVHDVAWDARRGRVVSAGGDGVVNLWDVEDGALVQSFSGHDAAVVSLDVDPLSGRIAMGSADSTISIWDPETKASLVLLGHEDGVLSVCFSPDGRRVLSGSADGLVKLWDVRGDLSTTVLESGAGAVQAVAFHPGGELVATADQSGGILLTDARTGLPLRRLVGHADPVNSLCFSKDGQWLLSASGDKTARLWDVAAGETVITYRGHEKWVECAVFSHDESQVLTGSGDKSVRLWDRATGAPLRVFEGHRFSVADIAVSPDGRTFASGGQRLFVRHLDEDEPVVTITKLRRRLLDLAFSPDGERLVSASFDGSTRIWEVATGELLAKVDDHDSKVRAVAFTPDGSRFATASNDKTIRIRESRTGETLLVLRGHTDDVLDLAFSADGRRLLSGSADGTARIWETEGRAERRASYLAEEQRREELRPVMDELFATHGLLEDVEQAIESSPDIEDSYRDTARLMARLWGPEIMAARSEAIVERTDASPAAYELAHRQAQEVVELDPWNPHHRLLVGMAEYRAGNYGQTRKTLMDLGGGAGAESSPTMDPDDDPGGAVTRLVYLAMAHERTGNNGDANDDLAAARRLLAQHPGLQSSALLGLLGEAEALIPPPSGGASVGAEGVRSGPGSLPGGGR